MKSIYRRTALYVAAIALLGWTTFAQDHPPGGRSGEARSAEARRSEARRSETRRDSVDVSSRDRRTETSRSNEAKDPRAGEVKPSERTSDASSGNRGRAEAETPGFTSRDSFDYHYQKHAQEFGNISRAEYLSRARQFRDQPPNARILEQRRTDGSARIDLQNGYFGAYGSDGTIITFFVVKGTPAERAEYFRRQAEAHK